MECADLPRVVEFLHDLGLTCHPSWTCRAGRPEINDAFVDLTVLASYCHPPSIRRDDQPGVSAHRSAGQFAIRSSNYIIQAHTLSSVGSSESESIRSNSIWRSTVSTTSRYHRGSNTRTNFPGVMSSYPCLRR